MKKKGTKILSEEKKDIGESVQNNRTLEKNVNVICLPTEH